MATEYSPLTLVLADLLERGLGATAGEKMRELLEIAIREHALEGENAPAWMFEFFSRILNHRLAPRTERYEIPRGYPHGEEGLCNLLLDIDRDVHPLGFDDYGEGVMWPISDLGLRVGIIREWNGEGYGVVIDALQ